MRLQLLLLLLDVSLGSLRTPPLTSVSTTFAFVKREMITEAEVSIRSRESCGSSGERQNLTRSSARIIKRGENVCMCICIMKKIEIVSRRVTLLMDLQSRSIRRRTRGEE